MVSGPVACTSVWNAGLMRLIGHNGYGVELGVVDYQFPDSMVPGQRRSWLIVEGAATCPQGMWRFRWQALTASDAIDLEAWIRSAAQPSGEDDAGRASIEFTEPNLAFTITGSDTNEIELQTSLDLEFSPPWRKHTRSGDPFTISCRISRADMLRAADDWAIEIARYPPEDGPTPRRSAKPAG